MTQSTFHTSDRPLHTAIIMDGNGRWAARRGSPRPLGHRAGAQAVRRVIEAAPGLGITTLSLYAFSSDNWARPRPEVRSLMDLLGRTLVNELPACRRNGVRVRVIGRRDRLPAGLLKKVEQTESETASGGRLHLRLAVDYSSRDALLKAARCGARSQNRHDFGRAINRAIHSDPATPDVDLLIRSGGEKRLSDFLLWESAYAELHFTDVLWPDFTARDLHEAILEFHSRERRYGGVDTSALYFPQNRRSAAGGCS